MPEHMPMPMPSGIDDVMPSLQTHPAVLALDTVGRIVAINRSYLGLTGHVRDEVVGRPVWMLLDLAERCAGRLGSLLDLPEGEGRHLPELAHLSRSGRRFRVDARVFAIAGGEGQASLRMVFARPEETDGVIRLSSYVQSRAWRPSHQAGDMSGHEVVQTHVPHLRLIKH